MNVRPKGVTAIALTDLAISALNIFIAILFFLPSTTLPGYTIGEEIWQTFWITIPVIGPILDALLSWVIIGYGVIWGVFYLIYGIVGFYAVKELWSMTWRGLMLTGILAILKVFYGYGLVVSWYVFKDPISARFEEDRLFCPHCEREIDLEYAKVLNECPECGRTIEDKYLF